MQPASLMRTKLTRAALALRSGARGVSSDTLLHNSIIPTYYFQKSLPRLPIPELKDTLDKYLYFVEPLLSPVEAEATRRSVEAFRTGAGPMLHDHLVKWDKEHKGTSYISEMWYDMYLKNRDPLPLNLNPQLTWMDDLSNPAKMDQAQRAANLIHAATRFYLTLEAEKLEPDVFHTKTVTKSPLFQHAVAKLVPEAFAWYAGYFGGAYALDMSQYTRLFKSTRVPKAGTDELRSVEKSYHIVVQRGPRFYTVEVLSKDGVPVTPGFIEAQLKAIIADSASASYTLEPPVGALSGAHRDIWAATRTKMEESPLNQASLKAIDDALFVLTLDDSKPTSHEDLSRAMLHGDVRNRWFDKCFNLIVCANGKAGINWEHAWGDGVAVLYFFNEVYKTTNAMAPRDVASPDGVSTVRLNWDLSNPAVVNSIRDTEKYSDDVIAATQLKVYQSESMTREDIKASQLNPDGVMQMIMQLAHWRAHGTTPSTYESASTAGFKHGRTEVVRPVTPLSVSMCKTFDNPDASWIDKYQALAKATSRHKKTTYDALMGKGVDRHLFALHKWAERLQPTNPSGPLSAVPMIFTDKAYEIFKDIRLSTSTLASPALQGGGFGPVSRTSYGVGYGNDDRGAHFHVMNYKGSTTHSGDFIMGAESALQDFHTAIAEAKKAGVIKPEAK